MAEESLKEILLKQKLENYDKIMNHRITEGDISAFNSLVEIIKSKYQTTRK